MRLLVLLTGIFFILSLRAERELNRSYAEPNGNSRPDTIVGHLISSSGYDTSYSNRLTYFVVIGKDTSCFRWSFQKRKLGERTHIDFQLESKDWKVDRTYKQRLRELSLVLSEAKGDFNFDSLTSINVGWFFANGDLVIDVTKQFYQKFGQDHKIATNYWAFERFLKKSKLATDLNGIFKQYSIVTDDVVIEKAFMRSKKEFLELCRTEKKESEMPDKVIDIIFCNVHLKSSKSIKR